MWVLFELFLMFTNFYRLDLHNKTCVALANLQGNHSNKTPTTNRTLFDLVKVTRSACSMFVDFLIKYIGAPNWVGY